MLAAHYCHRENKTLKTSFRSERHYIYIYIFAHATRKVWKATNGTNAQIIGCETSTPVDPALCRPPRVEGIDHLLDKKTHLIGGVDPSKTDKNRLSQVG